MIVRHAVMAMGTRFELVLGDGPMAGAIAEEAGELLLDWHTRVSAFSKGSDIGRLNAAAGLGDRAWVRLDGEVAELLHACIDLHHATRGAFDPTLGGAMRALGHRDQPSDGPSAGPSPAWGMAAFELDGVFGRIVRAGVELDLGGIAKGHALDRVAALLCEHGVAHALVHGGTSSAVGIGTAPDGSPWRVRIGGAEGPAVDLTDRALAVSAIAGRVAEGQGHVIDPRTGAAVSHRAQAAVLGRCARECDAWATALLVLDEADFDPRVELSDHEWMIWNTLDASPTLWETPAFEEA